MKMSKILIVDDEDQIRKLLARMLELEGYEIYQAADCKTALSEMKRAVPDVVLCDVFLPDGNGVDFVVRLKKEFPMSEVILLTEQCLQCRLHRSVTMMVPRMGSLFLKRIVFKPKTARGRKEEIFMGEHPFF